MSPAPRVVLVDDTEDLRQLMRIALKRAGWEVVGEAGDGAAGIEVVREQDPDLVVLDLSMPVMDGLEALPHIRASCPQATIVVMSGFGAAQMTDRAMARGADGYLQKGAPLKTVVESLADAMARRGSPAEADPAPVAASGDATPGVPELVENAPVPVLELTDDADLSIRYANPAARSLLGDGAVAGTALATVSGPLAAFVTTFRTDADTSRDVTIADVPMQATLRHGASSLLLYLDAGAADVAALRRAVATTAHELRGPVAVICGAAETLEAGGELDAELDTETVHQLTEAMARQARILDGITTDLLTTAQARRGTLLVQVREVAPADVVRTVVAQRYDADVVVEDDRPVLADPLRLEQIVSNLLSNAGKYGRPPVTVTIRPAGDRVAIDVADHGDGVPASFRERLFVEFSRAQPTAAPGSGLGLHVVRALVEAQGGAASYAPGPAGGAVFTVTLPAA